jgi:uncharacterized membrane protein
MGASGSTVHRPAPPAPSLERLERWALRHWLALFNTAAGVFAGLPVLAPLLMAAGWTSPALLIYAAYGTTCHQWPGRSYFLFGPQVVYAMDQLDHHGLAMAHDFLGDAAMGFKMAYCERNFAIYSTVFLAGCAFALWRSHWRPLPPRVFLLCLVPMALDGLGQLAGLHESTWQLRSLTGGLAGLAAVWLAYPRLDRALRQVPATTAPATMAASGERWVGASRRVG